MSTLAENVAKVTAAHAALKTAIAAKGVTVPDGTKLSGMPALISQIETPPVPTNPRAVFAYDNVQRIVVPKLMVVDFGVSRNLNYCFRNCNLLTSLVLPAGFGQNATSLGYCFYSCTSLESLTLPAGFGQNATNIGLCFTSCTSLTSLVLPAGFGMDAAVMYKTFDSCTSLTSLVLPAGFGQNATNLGYCFYGCTSLASLTLPAGFGQNATNLDSCLRDCSSLETITGNPNFKTSFNISSCQKLTHDSLMVIINGLQTVAPTKNLILGETNLAKLTDAEKKIATDKGWTLA